MISARTQISMMASIQCHSSPTYIYNTILTLPVRFQVQFPLLFIFGTEPPKTKRTQQLCQLLYNFILLSFIDFRPPAAISDLFHAASALFCIHQSVNYLSASDRRAIVTQAKAVTTMLNRSQFNVSQTTARAPAAEV